MSTEDLLSAARSLFPTSEVSLRRVSAKDPHAMRLVPPGEHARLAVPTSSSSAASRTLHRPSAGDSVLRTILRSSLAAAERTRLLRLFTSYGIAVDRTEGSIVEHLSNIFDQDVSIGLMVGSARANRKPVLNVFSKNGEELGFAKVGLGSLANRLVAAEAHALDCLALMELVEMQVPATISTKPWLGHSVLVMTPLRADRIQGRLDLPFAALNELARSPSERLRIRDSEWLKRMEKTCGKDAINTSLPALLAAVADRHGDEEWDFSPWHGDFGPWNMARTSSAPMVWDWERFDPGMPRGMDAVHFLVHREIAGAGEEGLPIHRLLSASAQALKSCGGSVPATSTPVLLATYLLTYAVRFVCEGLEHQVPATTALGLRYASHLSQLLHTQDHL